MDLQLNIFHFLKDPYRKEEGTGEPAPAESRAQLIVERERDLRFYYDDKLGDYVKAGFRLCEDNGWTELHRCMCKREFQVLVLAFPSYDAVFAGSPLTDFAFAFACPVILVGPGGPDEITLNSPAALLAHCLPLGDIRWSCLEASPRILAGVRSGAAGR
jgi:hypothetical protein